jgi:hypothetical protein
VVVGTTVTENLAVTINFCMPVTKMVTYVLKRTSFLKKNVSVPNKIVL